MYKIFFLFLIGGSIGLFVTMPQNIFAAQLDFKLASKSIDANGATVVEVLIDPQTKNLNVVDGLIVFQGTISDKLSVEVETDESILTLWPKSPIYSASEKAIRFSGGVPGGFNKEGLLFKMHLSSVLAGDIKIVWVGGSAYLNDGKGTTEHIFSKSLSLNLNSQNVPDGDTPRTSFDFFGIRNVIILLLILIALFSIYRYVHKKTF